MTKIIARLVLLLYIFYLLLFLWLIKSWQLFLIPNISRLVLIVAFLIKCAVSFVFWWIYTYYYGDNLGSNDTYKFFYDGLSLRNIYQKDSGLFLKIIIGFYDLDINTREYLDTMNHWFKPYNYGVFNDNQTVIRLHSLISFISAGNFQIHSLFFNFLNFIGIIWMIKSCEILKSKSGIYMLIAAFIFPNLLFWLAGPLKESILIFGLGLFIYSISLILKKFKPKYLIMFLFGFLTLSMVKNYILISLLPGLFICSLSILLKWSLKKSILIGLSFLLISFCVLEFALTDTVIIKEISQKQADFINISRDGQAGSYFEVPSIADSWLNFAIYSPIGFFNSLARPFIWESHNLLTFISALENLLFIAFLIYFGMGINVIKHAKFGFILMVSVLIVFILAGLVSPVAGALVRYTIPSKLMLIIFIVINSNQIPLKIKKINEIF